VQAATRKLGSPGRCCFALACLAYGLALCPLPASAKCTFAKLAELPITMSGLRPTIMTKINGADARFALDSGAFYSMISSATAAQFELRQKSLHGIKVNGVGGATDVSVATVKAFTLAGIAMHDVDFLVGGSEIGGGAIGMLGQNFLERWDVEYDFAKGVVRLFKADDCKHTRLAYWVAPDQAASMMDINRTTFLRPHTMGRASVNGAQITVLFDTGASTSVLSLSAASRAGVKPDMAGVVEAGYSTGIGRGAVKTYIAPFASFKIGDDEEVKNTRLRMADINLSQGDMLLGADFFLSHHVLVANSQQRLYFTYNGGPVFNLSRNLPADAAARADDPGAAKQDEPADAAAFARRGAASLGRRDFRQAISDFTRARELNPNEPEFAYERGMAYWQNKEPVPAMSDLDQALALNSDYLAARMARARLRLSDKDRAGAAADLDAADQVAPKQSDVRFELAQLYEQTDFPARAVPQYGLWIANHPDDSKIVQALHHRCRVRAVQGQDLEKALDDCNAAYRRGDKSVHPGIAAILGSRGLVRLRLGNYDKAIADYDESLRLAPKNASSLYGRGIARLRKNKTAEGEADLAQAKALSSTVAKEFEDRGITP
jgi:tetratricopeptide (TPR) repeat protein/predicted aspartyl protease